MGQNNGGQWGSTLGQMFGAAAPMEHQYAGAPMQVAPGGQQWPQAPLATQYGGLGGINPYAMPQAQAPMQAQMGGGLRAMGNPMAAAGSLTAMNRPQPGSAPSKPPMQGNSGPMRAQQQPYQVPNQNMGQMQPQYASNMQRQGMGGALSQQLGHSNAGGMPAAPFRRSPY